MQRGARKYTALLLWPRSCLISLSTSQVVCILSEENVSVVSELFQGQQALSLLNAERLMTVRPPLLTPFSGGVHRYRSKARMAVERCHCRLLPRGSY
jgi:hypothetical protein